MDSASRRPACHSVWMGDERTTASYSEVIVAALRERRPGMPLLAAQLEAETIILRLQEAGLLPPLSVGWPKAEGTTHGRDRIVLLPDGKLQCMVCENLWPLVDGVPPEYLSARAKR